MRALAVFAVAALLVAAAAHDVRSLPSIRDDCVAVYPRLTLSWRAFLTQPLSRVLPRKLNLGH